MSKIAIINSEYIPTIYNALSLYNATSIQNTGKPNEDALDLMYYIENAFKDMFTEGKAIYIP